MWMEFHRLRHEFMTAEAGTSTTSESSQSGELRALEFARSAQLAFFFLVFRVMRRAEQGLIVTFTKKTVEKPL